MPVPCPHCKEAIDNVVPTETMTKRLAEKDAATKAVREELATAVRELATARPAAEELATVRAELAGIKTQAERSAAFAEHGIPETVRARMGRLYDAEQDGVEEAERVPFADWLKADDTKAVFGAHYRGAAAAAGATPKTPVKPGTLPAAKGAAVAGETPGAKAAGTDTPTPAAKKTPKELRAELEAYKLLPPKERLAKLAEHARTSAAAAKAE